MYNKLTRFIGGPFHGQLCRGYIHDNEASIQLAITSERIDPSIPDLHVTVRRGYYLRIRSTETENVFTWKGFTS